MVFRCPNIQAHYNEAVIYLNFGTSKNNEFFIWNKMENILFLGVPILKHIKVDINPTACRTAKTPMSFRCSECSGGNLESLLCFTGR